MTKLDLTMRPNRTWTDTWKFLKRFVRHPTQVGAIAPSSEALVETMVEWIQWQSATGVVEYGPGTGVFTSEIVKRLRPDAKFMAIERAKELATLTRQRCPGVLVHEASAADVGDLMVQAGMQHADAIICGLPWASFPEVMQRSIMEATWRAMPTGGQFATFAYWQGVALPAGRRFHRLLIDSFTSVQRSRTVWRNLPPAFVYRCVK
ncbi:MAG: hypothetical protein AAGC97_06085 [Planctomycetota bacterium]